MAAYQDSGFAYQSSGYAYQDGAVFEQPSGGWPFLYTYESELNRRRDEARRRRDLEEESERIPDEVDRSIALLLREQEAKDAERQNLERLATLARQNADVEAARQYSEKVAKAFARALAQENYSAIEALDRELRKAREAEEETLLTVTLMLVLN